MDALVRRRSTSARKMISIPSLFLKVVRRRRLRADLEAELAFHREMATDQGNHIGLGNVTVLKESALDLWRFNAFENALRDLGLAVRRIRRNPVYTVAAIGSLALGIGISAAMFTILNAVVFRPLPYADAQRLVWVTEVLKANSTDEITLTPDFLDWRRANHTFESMAAFNYDTHIVTGLAEPIEIHSVRASASLLPILHVKPMLGRIFRSDEDYAGRERVAMLSYVFWRDHLGSSASVLAKPILLDGEQYSIIGILPQGFVFPGDEEVDAMTPLAKNEAGELARDGRVITIVHNVIGRLKPGITQAQAHDDLAAIQAHLPLPPFHPTITIKMLPLRAYLFGDQKITASVLVIGSLLFLLVASANLGNLALSQLMQRDRELAIRRALGAARTRVIAQLVMENAVITVSACIAGLGVAICIRNLIAAMPQYQARFYAELPVDGRVLLFTGGALAGIVLVFGLLPALRVSDVQLATAIAAGQTTVAGRRLHLRYLSLVAVVEIAMVVALSSSAALMLKSFWNMRYRELGFQSQHAITSTLNLSASRYDDEHRQVAFMDRLLERASAIPGVVKVAISAASEIPPGAGHATNIARIEGRPLPRDSRQKPVMRNQEVSAGYFSILQVPLIAGRLLRDSDGSDAAPVVVVSKEFVRRYFPQQSAIGHRVQAGERDNIWYTIVGVVGDVKSSGLASSPEPVLYTPYAQSDGRRLRELGVILQSFLPIASIAPSFRKAVAAIDPEQPISSMETIDERLNHSVARPRFTASLLATLSILGTVLAMLGVYGLTSCRVRSQTREIAVRQALGAPPSRLIYHVIRSGIVVAGVGLLFGLALTVAITRLISTMLFEVSPRDPMALIAVCLAVMLSALAACFTPALRATRLDPLVSLRET